MGGGGGMSWPSTRPPASLIQFVGARSVPALNKKVCVRRGWTLGRRVFYGGKVKGKKDVGSGCLSDVPRPLLYHDFSPLCLELGFDFEFPK